ISTNATIRAPSGAYADRLINGFRRGDRFSELAGDYVPDQQLVVLVAAGHQPVAVRAKGQGAHVVAEPQYRARLSRACIPEAHRAVPTPRGKPASVRTEGDRVDITGVPTQHRQGRLRIYIPDPHGLVPYGIESRLPAHGGQPAAAWGEHNPTHAP